MKKTAIASSLLFALPMVAFAQQLTPVKNLIIAIGNILNMLVPILIVLALVVFFYGLVQYIWKAGKGGKLGKQTMIAGLLSLFVMVSIWGIINLMQSALGVSGSASVTIPQVPTVSR